jgi:NADP-dependent 3-hydroxy acid dehydrogenase YdfG
MSETKHNKVVVITGASSGLGEAAARLLSQQGRTVVLAARRDDRIMALAAETDVADAEQVKALVDQTIHEFGRIDVMLNNAGLMPLSPLDRLKIDEWDRMIDVNIKGVLYGIAAALPHMQRQKSGHIINVSSVAGHKTSPNSTVYSATKFAVRAISEGLRQEVKPYNIRTTIISPGAVKTELLNTISDEDIMEATTKAASVGVSADAFARMVAFAIEQPEDVDVNEILFRPTAQVG